MATPMILTTISNVEGSKGTGANSVGTYLLLHRGAA